MKTVSRNKSMRDPDCGEQSGNVVMVSEQSQSHVHQDILASLTQLKKWLEGGADESANVIFG